MTTVYIKTGTTSWTVPAGCYSINITIIGSGGQGYGGTDTAGKGGYGGPAASPITANGITVTPGQTITVSVGARGSASTNHTSNTSAPWYNAGSNGNATTFDSSSLVGGPWTSRGATVNSSGLVVNNAYGGDGTSTTVTGDGSSNAAQGGGSGGAAGSGYGAGGGGAHAGAYNGGQASDGIIIITYTAISAPVASFTYTPSSGNAPLSVSFTDTSTNTPTSWSWSFGDGNTSTAQNPSHTYTTAGTFTVSLTATNAAGSSSPVTHTVSVTSAPVAAFVLNPNALAPIQAATGYYYPQQIKCYDQSYVSGTVVNQWFWTCSLAGSSFSNANAQNPILTIPAAASDQTFTVSLYVKTSDNQTSATTSYTVNQHAAGLAKPAASDYYMNLSIFVYTPPSATTQAATILNRVRTPGNHLFFTDFECTGAIDKAGTLNFTVVDIGQGTATERALVSTANNWVVVVLGGTVIWSGQILKAVDGVTQIYAASTNYHQWSVQCESDIGKMKTQYVNTAALGLTTGTTGAIVSKLIQQNLSTDTNWNGMVESSIISREGNSISYTITSGDMYDQFIALANASGFDWRTRMQTYNAASSSIAPGWSSPSTFTFGNTVTPYTTNSFAGKWVLFLSTQYNVITLAFTAGGANNGGVQLYAGDQVRETSGTVFGTVVQVNTASGSWAAGTAAGTIVIYSGQTWTASQYFDGLTAGANCAYVSAINSTVSTPNTTGVMSFGYCASNTTTVLTLSSVQNQGMLKSTGTAYALVLVGSVLDYAWTLEPPQPCLTMLNNATTDANTSQALNFSDNSNYKSLATVITVKGTTQVPSQGTGVGSTITSTLYAKDQWDNTYGFFKRSTYVTQKMDGYIYSFTGGTSVIVLIGQGYALKAGSGTSGDAFYLYLPETYGATPLGAYYVTGISTQTQADGTLTTTITSNVLMGTSGTNGTKYDKFIAAKTYVADPTWLSNSYSITCYLGSVTNNTRQYQAAYVGTSADATYGNYITITGSGQLGANPCPALPGTIISSTDPSPPNVNSPLGIYGPILYTQTVANNTTQSDLDVYATQYLVNKAFYLRVASVTAKLIMDFATSGCRPQYQTFLPRPVTEGERVTVLTSATLSPGNNPYAVYTDGQYVNQWQVMSWTLDGSTMQVTCELGDYEKNTYTLMQQLTSSTNQNLT